MQNILRDYAIRNIWCNPRQDSQFTFKPKRISGIAGVRNRARVVDRIITLPKHNKRYHLFQIGQINISLLNVFRDLPDWKVDRWISIDDSINYKHVLTMVYNNQGVMLPGYICYLMYMDERNLILAVEETSGISVDFRTDALYLRVYQNAFFESNRFLGTIKLYSTGKRVNTVPEILALQNQFNTYSSYSGKCFAYINGMRVQDITLVNTTIGDHVYFVYDASVAKTIVFNIKTLPTFISHIDASRRYCLHYSNDGVNNIEFFDDNEMFILKDKGAGKYKGIYAYRHQISTVRMVTHRDYSLDVNAVNYWTTQLRDLIDDNTGLLEDYNIELVIRNSGYDRSLVHEHHRLHELYKMNPFNVRYTMLGTVQKLYLWRAEKLEASMYSRLMSSLVTDIDDDRVIEALGYNAISKLFGDTPVKLPLSEPNRAIELPKLMHENATVYEYDQHGNLLEYHYNVSGGEYIARNALTVYFEALRGEATNTPDVQFHSERFTLPVECNWRLYRAHITGGILDNLWMDITNSDDYEIVNNEIVYTGSDLGVYLMLRTDKKFLAYDTHITPVDGNIRFPISEMENRDGVVHHYIMPVPAGELDVFLNGKLLVEGIGYNVNFPEICIFAKEYFIQPANTTPQHIHVRFKGLCNSDLMWEKPADIGFIEHGVLSNNNKFDIRDDKVLRITVDGSIKTRDELTFSEGYVGVSTINPINGKPYMIRDIVVPLKEITDEDTYSFRAKSLLVDKHVGEYMTVMHPQPPRNAPSAITARHQIFSPFICKILYRIINGFIPASVYSANLTDQQVLNICQPYEDWLVFDPIHELRAIDEDYVVIHPHAHYSILTISLHAYRFLQAVVRLYAGNKVNLSEFLQIEEALV